MVAGLWFHKLQNPAYRSAFNLFNHCTFMTLLKHTLWALPLFCFFGSYFTLYYLFSPSVISTPSLIGKQLSEALQVLSENNINMRILSQKEDNDIPAGTIVSQIPSAQSSIRPHQSLFVVITKQAEPKKAPHCINKKIAECLELAQKEHIHVKTYMVPHLLDDICIGQLPAPNQPLIDNKITLYLSKNPEKQSLIPSFKNRCVEDVSQFLTEHNIKYALIHAKHIDTQHSCKNCIITQQKPLAGSLIDLKKPLTIQLFI
jgi:beta-lactam-binding protein with PASTA domain